MSSFAARFSKLLPMIHYRLQGNGADGFALDAEIFTPTYSEAMAICRGLVAIKYVTRCALLDYDTYELLYDVGEGYEIM